MSSIIDMCYMDEKQRGMCTKCLARLLPTNELSGLECLCSLIEGKQHLTLFKTSKHLPYLCKLKLRFLCGKDNNCLKELCEEWFPIKYPESWYNLVLFGDNFISLAATLDGKIVGVLIAEIKSKWKVPKEDADLLPSCFPQDSKVAYILSLGVHGPYRRHGIASFLLQSFILYVSTCLTQATCVKAIYLHVLATNLVAIKFYQQHHFQMLHFLPCYYVINGLPKDGYSYVLHLNGGRFHNNWSDYFTVLLRILYWLQICKIPKCLCGGAISIIRLFSTSTRLSPFVAKTRQYHNL